LSNAQKAAMKTKDLSQRLITLSKGETLVTKTASIVPIIFDAVERALDGSKVRCDINIPDEPWLLEIDEYQMKQAVHHLIENAKESMPNAGRIRVSLRNLVIEEGRVPNLEPGRYVKLRIKDRGVGIPKAHLEKIFDPYFSTKKDGDEKREGLGLTLCHSIIKKHHGHIVVDSTPDVGTTVVVYLPVRGKKKKQGSGTGEEKNIP
jgi:signal transduction histidine kinase